MRTKPLLLTLSLFLALLVTHAASAQVSVRIGTGGYYPRAYYGPRHYYPPRPVVVVYPAPPPVIVAPRPVYYAPRPVYYAPRPYYYHGHGHGRRW